MKRDLLFPFHSLQTILGFRAWILQQLILHSNSTSGNLYEAKIFIRNNSSILKNHLRNSVCFFLDLLFCDDVQNYEIGISVTLFWKISTLAGFFKQEVAITIISSILVSMNINANLSSFLWFLYLRHRRSMN